MMGSQYLKFKLIIYPLFELVFKCHLVMWPVALCPKRGRFRKNGGTGFKQIIETGAFVFVFLS
jgi:hypothetical protein